MCGRFTQFRTREAYLVWQGDDSTSDTPLNPEPIEHYYVI
jgi:hypothetical protein